VKTDGLDVGPPEAARDSGRFFNVRADTSSGVPLAPLTDVGATPRRIVWHGATRRVSQGGF